MLPDTAFPDSTGQIVPANAAEICSYVAEAAARKEPVRICGNGTWMNAGRPVAMTSQVLHMRKCAGITDYVPGDFVLTASAGTTLREIAEATLKNGQCLALDPFGSSDGTLGATVATASSGPLATGFGRVRDLVLGVSAVTGEGRQITVGGRVVKNVAGFDLVRLLTGSWGTLGVLTEISMRLHALPQQDETIVVEIRDRLLEESLASLRSMAIAPIALQLMVDALSARLLDAPTDCPVMLVRLGGNAARVESQRQEFARLGKVASVDSSVWPRFREFENTDISRGDPVAIFRVSDSPARLASLLGTARGLVERNERVAFMSANPMQGVIRIVMGDSLPVGELLTGFLAHGARIIGECLDPADWQLLPSALSVGGPISAGIRARFDPQRILNRGIIGSI